MLTLLSLRGEAPVQPAAGSGVPQPLPTSPRPWGQRRCPGTRQGVGRLGFLLLPARVRAAGRVMLMARGALSHQGTEGHCTHTPPPPVLNLPRYQGTAEVDPPKFTPLSPRSPSWGQSMGGSWRGVTLSHGAEPCPGAGGEGCPGGAAPSSGAHGHPQPLSEAKPRGGGSCQVSATCRDLRGSREASCQQRDGNLQPSSSVAGHESPE